MYIQDVKSLTKEILDERINATIGKPCIICEHPAAVAGIFEPNNSQKFGAPPDKIRLIFYPI